jgi:hypothetical protein
MPSGYDDRRILPDLGGFPFLGGGGRKTFEDRVGWVSDRQDPLPEPLRSKKRLKTLILI